MEKDKHICSVCGTVICTDEIHEFEGKVLCEYCFDEQTTICDNCNARITNKNIWI